jgi:hypothetical protein
MRIRRLRRLRRLLRQGDVRIVARLFPLLFVLLFLNQCNLRSKPTTSCFFSKKLCCQESNIWLSELKRSGHHLVPLSRDAIVVSFEDLVDQFVCAQ